MGGYIDSVPTRIRSQAARLPGRQRCRRSARAAPAPRMRRLHLRRLQHDGPRPQRPPEVHEVGEIWAETLWDLRAAVGSEVARAIITQGMRLSPPEPTFLDERDAILTADGQLFPDGDHSGAIWRGVRHPRDGVGRRAARPRTWRSRASSSRRRRRWRCRPRRRSQGQTVTPRRLGLVRRGRHRRLLRLRLPGRRHPGRHGDDQPAADVHVRERRHVPPDGDRPRQRGPDRHRRPAARRGRADAAGRHAAGLDAAAGTASRAPAITLVRKGTKGRVRFTIRCDSRCAGSAKLTVTRKLAKRLHLGKRRTVGTLRVRIGKRGPEALHDQARQADAAGDEARRRAPHHDEALRDGDGPRAAAGQRRGAVRASDASALRIGPCSWAEARSANGSSGSWRGRARARAACS